MNNLQFTLLLLAIVSAESASEELDGFNLEPADPVADLPIFINTTFGGLQRFTSKRTTSLPTNLSELPGFSTQNRPPISPIHTPLGLYYRRKPLLRIQSAFNYAAEQVDDLMSPDSAAVTLFRRNSDKLFLNEQLEIIRAELHEERQRNQHLVGEVAGLNQRMQSLQDSVQAELRARDAAIETQRTVITELQAELNRLRYEEPIAEKIVIRDVPQNYENSLTKKSEEKHKRLEIIREKRLEDKIGICVIISLGAVAIVGLSLQVFFSRRPNSRLLV
jgi:hypothetical protein